MLTIDFTGKVALVTGGAGGISSGIGRRFGDAGAKVYLADINDAKLKTIVEEMRKDGIDAVASHMDVTNEAEVKGVIDSIVANEGALDILCCASGVIYAKPYMDTTEAELLRCLSVNLVGTNNCCQAALRHMIPKRQGKIITIGSATSRMGSATLSHYSMSKFGIVGLTQSIALAVAAHNINVNGICPGFVNTEMMDIIFAENSRTSGVPVKEIAERYEQTNIPLKRFQTPQDIGEAACFLASDLAHNITGQCLNVCGAMRLN